MTPSLFDDQDQPEVFDYEPQPWEADGDPYEHAELEHAQTCELDPPHAVADCPDELEHGPSAPVAPWQIDDPLAGIPARADSRHVEAPPLPSSGVDADGHYHCAHAQHATLPWCPWYPATGALH